jgi:hypothetical protein
MTNPHVTEEHGHRVLSLAVQSIDPPTHGTWMGRDPARGSCRTPCDYAHLYCSPDLTCLLIMNHSNIVTKKAIIIVKNMICTALRGPPVPTYR